MDMMPSELYGTLRNKKSLFNYMPVGNIPSVIEHGILSFNRSAQINHESIASTDVQLRRDKTVNNGLKLHDYASLYFDYHNPMLYSKKGDADNFCVLAISTEIMNHEGVVLTDRNAATTLVRFMNPYEGLTTIDFSIVFEKNWNYEDPIAKKNHKAIKCAEVLVPHCVPYDYIKGAYAVSSEVEQTMRDYGFQKRIIVKPEVFYRR